jgi:hypothetical protein
MKTPILTLMFASMFLAKFSFSQTQRLETTGEPKAIKTTPVLYCGMVYFDDSTKVEAPKKQTEKTPVTRKQTKKSMPTKSERPAELRRED